VKLFFGRSSQSVLWSGLMLAAVFFKTSLRSWWMAFVVGILNFNAFSQWGPFLFSTLKGTGPNTFCSCGFRLE
jgi:hypothetical protein